jgi:hypothetical protein
MFWYSMTYWSGSLEDLNSKFLCKNKINEFFNFFNLILLYLTEKYGR